MRTRHLCHIPTASLDAATDLQREITGLENDPPCFDMSRARGTDRARARLYAHVWLWTEDQTQEFVRRLPEVGGQSRQTYPDTKDVLPEVAQLGSPKRPDLERMTVAQLRAKAQEEGRDITGITRKSDLIDAFETEETTP